MALIAHLTDPHVGPLPRPRLRELLNKRATGWFNWHRSRRGSHDMELLAALVADMKAAAPDHIACTGDVSNIGLPNEWPTAQVFMEGLGTPDRVSFVPGNHDAYVQGSLEGLLAAIGAYASDDGGPGHRFPFVRRRGRIALVGLSSAIPTLPFVASGRLGRRQLAAAEAALAALKAEGLIRIVLIHHPPHIGGAQPGRNLSDAPAFERMIARTGAELVLHGHNHVGSIAYIGGAGRRVPVVGAPSASARGGTLTHPAGYHLYRVAEDGRVTGQLRGLKADGSIGDLGPLPLDA